MRLSIAGLALALGVLATHGGTPAASELDDVIRNPGNWNQMCGMPPPIPSEVPLHLYGLIATRYFTVSDANMARLRRDREAVAQEIVRRLHKMDVPRSPGPSAQRAGFQDSGQDPEGFSGLLEQIILELPAPEALPELLRLEDKLDGLISSGSAAKLPEENLDSSIMISVTKGDTPRFGGRLVDCLVIQREMLSVMAGLLRKVRFQPMLDSDYEAHYKAALVSASATGELARIKHPSDVPPEQASWIVFDPIYHVPTYRLGPANATIPFSQEIRNEIRGFVQDYLKAKASAGNNDSSQVSK